MSQSLFPQHVIAAKRDGRVLTTAEISAFVQGATDGTWADYQLSAMLMAIFLRGMTIDETAALTNAMMQSGTVVTLPNVSAPKVDKHSTGGVGDKVSIILAPMVAACGVAVPMMSGRGLGHTGGTLDKLESIPGFRVGLTLPEYTAQMEKLGVALIGQTAELAPADKKLYSLRDVTGTVESIPLICASILSKKLAEGLDSLVLDVKFGSGAFMREKAKAQELAQTLVSVCHRLGKPARALLTAMDQPLGCTVGNALEITESLACLRGEGPEDLMEVTYALGVEMLMLAKVATTPDEARVLLEKAISSGLALEKFRAIVMAQDGDVRMIDSPQLLPQAAYRREIKATTGGYIASVDALKIALAALKLGAGRTRVDSKIDPSVGISHLAKIGDQITVGQPIAMIHAASETDLVEASSAVFEAIKISTMPAPKPLLIDSVIGGPS